MAERSPVTVELDEMQRQYLMAMVSQYGLPDLGKAVRCMVNHAMQTPGSHDEIFKTIRCTGC